MHTTSTLRCALQQLAAARNYENVGFHARATTQSRARHSGSQRQIVLTGEHRSNIKCPVCGGPTWVNYHENVDEWTGKITAGWTLGRAGTERLKQLS